MLNDNNFKTDPSFKCFSCGIKHPKVEVKGIFYCPNALCMGCGGGWFRQRLNSYMEVEYNRHIVDEKEWLKKGILYNKENKIRRTRFFHDRRKK